MTDHIFRHVWKHNVYSNMYLFKFYTRCVKVTQPNCCTCAFSLRKIQTLVKV